MHDILLERQNEWASDINPNLLFYKYAGELNLDVALFTSAYKSADIKKRVERDYQSGIQRGVNSTPSFFLNGKKIEQNPQSYDAFKTLLEQTNNAS
jgi:protein-disulfide isomerase